jgi:hypothetical protein
VSWSVQGSRPLATAGTTTRFAFSYVSGISWRPRGIAQAASTRRRRRFGEWVDDDVAMIEEAETTAWHQHHDYSAEILHRARLLAAVGSLAVWASKVLRAARLPVGVTSLHASRS